MLDKILFKIENSQTLGSLNQANRKMAPLHPVMILLVLWFHYTQDIKILIVWQIFTYIFAFSFSLSLAKDILKETTQALLIAFITVLIFIYKDSIYLLIYSSFTSIVMSRLYIALKKLKLNVKALPQAFNDTFSREIQIILLVLISFGTLILLNVNVGLIPVLTDLILKGLSSLIGILIVIFCVSYLWTQGYHGANIINRLLRIFYLEMMLFNISQWMHGSHNYYFGAETFYQWTIWIGGSGATLGLALALRFLSKDKELQYIGKSAIIPALFNINEEIIFGVPIVRNKKYIIPFFLAPMISATLAYIAILKAYVSYPLLPATWILPMPLGIFVSTIFDIRSLVLALILILVTMLVYLPFLLKDDKERVIMSKH